MDALVKDLAMEISVDLGVDVSLHVVEKILKKRVPKLITKAASQVAFKAALTQAVLKNYAAMTSKAFVTMGKAVSGLATVFSIFGAVSFIVDLIDPQMYNYLLTGSMVDSINRRLDVQYFQLEDNFNQEVTPEYVWDYVLPHEDQSDQYTYFAEKVEEYLQALRPQDTVGPPPKPTHRTSATIQQWTWTIHWILSAMLLMLCIMFVQWIHVWVCVGFSF